MRFSPDLPSLHYSVSKCVWASCLDWTRRRNLEPIESVANALRFFRRQTVVGRKVSDNFFALSPRKLTNFRPPHPARIIVWDFCSGRAKPGSSRRGPERHETPLRREQVSTAAASRTHARTKICLKGGRVGRSIGGKHYKRYWVRYRDWREREAIALWRRGERRHFFGVTSALCSSGRGRRMLKGKRGR